METRWLHLSAVQFYVPVCELISPVLYENVFIHFFIFFQSEMMLRFHVMSLLSLKRISVIHITAKRRWENFFSCYINISVVSEHWNTLGNTFAYLHAVKVTPHHARNWYGSISFVKYRAWWPHENSGWTFAGVKLIANSLAVGIAQGSHNSSWRFGQFHCTLDPLFCILLFFSAAQICELKEQNKSYIMQMFDFFLLVWPVPYRWRLMSLSCLWKARPAAVSLTHTQESAST